MDFIHMLLPYILTFSWRDGIEITFFTMVVYYISRFLKTDTQKNLLGYLYLYYFLMVGAHIAELSLMFLVLTLASPIIIIVFILIHQHTLQKNFITLHAQKQSTLKSTGPWIHTFLKVCLNHLYQQKPIYCAIERTDALDPFLTIPFKMHALIEEQLLEMVFKHYTPDSDKMILISRKGILHAINCTFKKERYQEIWASPELKDKHAWPQEALFYATKSDALFFAIDPQSHTFTLIAHGKLIDKVPIDTAVTLIEQCIAQTSNPYPQGFDQNDNTIVSSHRSTTTR